MELKSLRQIATEKAVIAGFSGGEVGDQTCKVTDARQISEQSCPKICFFLGASNSRATTLSIFVVDARIGGVMV